MHEYEKAKWAYYTRFRGVLPSSYREVSYLESSGEAYIDTDVAGGSGVAVSGDFLRTGGEGVVFGCVQAMTPSSSTMRCFMQVYTSSNGAVSFFHDTKTTSVKFYPPINAKLAFTADFQTGVFAISDSSQSDSVLPYTMAVSIYLFGRHVYTADTGAHSVSNICNAGFRIYKLQVKSMGNFVRKYIPSVRLSDSKPGMYDLCGSICPLTGTPFYVNFGTGADFLWGELS